MPSSTRKCLLCGKQYQYCPNCRRRVSQPAYSLEFDTENCKNIFQICTDFNMELITKDEAKKLLLKCDLSKRESFAKSAKNTIDKILTDDKKTFTKPIEDKPIKKSTHEVVK